MWDLLKNFLRQIEAPQMGLSPMLLITAKTREVEATIIARTKVTIERQPKKKETKSNPKSDLVYLLDAGVKLKSIFGAG